VFMEKEEIRALTRRTTGPACARVLARLKIPFKPDEDGFPIVLKSAAQAPFESSQGRRSLPNPSRLEAHLGTKKTGRQRAA
jgi:hypothetical protein